VGEKWGYPNNQIDPNRSKSNQIKSNRSFLYPNQIKLKARFDLIYLFATLHSSASTLPFGTGSFNTSKVDSHLCWRTVGLQLGELLNM
jgi:hypothetical protein